MPNPSDVTVRNFREEDLAQVVSLYAEHFAESPGFVRSEEFLKHFMHYPGVDKNSVFVTEVNSKITGFAVVSVTSEQGGLIQGNVIELKINHASSMHVLIHTIEEYCKKKDVDTIVLVAPTQPGTEEVLKDWLKLDTGVMMAKELSLPPLLRALLSAKKIRNSYAGKQVAFHIGDEKLNARITLEQIYVSDSNRKSEKAVTRIQMSSHTFLRIVLGQLNPYTAFVTGRIRIRDTRNIVPMLRLLYMMRIAQPIYTSLADRL